MTQANEKAPDAVIEQINLGYDNEQDRLLLRVGLSDDSELAAWLTRRVVKTITHHIQEVALHTAMSEVQVLELTDAMLAPSQPSSQASHSAKDQPQTMEPAVPLQKTAANKPEVADTPTRQAPNFRETYQTRKQARFSEPLLVTACEFKARAETGRNQTASFQQEGVQVELTSKQGPSVSIVLSQDMLQALGQMLQLAIREAGWELALTAGQAIIVKDAADRPVLH